MTPYQAQLMSDLASASSKEEIERLRVSYLDRAKNEVYEFNLALDLIRDGVVQENAELKGWGLAELQKIFD